MVVLNGRYAGRKAIVVKAFEEGSKEHPFPHALVTGINRHPLRVTKSMSQKKILKRSKVKPFIKILNFNHLMPTRYTINDLDVKAHVKPEAVVKQAGKTEALKSIKKVFEERYLTKTKSAGGAQYFFKKLRF